MKIAMISDTHNHQPPDDQMPDADVLLHAGDFCGEGKLKELIAQASWLGRLAEEKYKHVVVVAGNHDFVLEAFMKEGREKELRERIFKGIHYLRDSGVTIDGKYFYGMPWQPRFFDWAFNCDRGLKMRRYTDQIPLYTNVLLTHGPPHGVLDYVGGQRVGCEDLFDRVQIVKPQVHVFGHIHCAYGAKTFTDTQYFNASYVNEKYNPAHEPWVTEI